MIEYEHICISLGGRPVLRDVSLRIEAGEVFCVVGKSGVGKSVMIKQLVGLLRPDSGVVRFEGRDVGAMTEGQLMELRRECGMVFQHATLFDSMTCLENVALPLRVHYDLSESRARERAMGYLAQLGVSHLGDREPAALGPSHDPGAQGSIVRRAHDRTRSPGGPQVR
jgi:phospholipid/cholesterol/gamma-HCH transport system ATP-binding protein